MHEQLHCCLYHTLCMSHGYAWPASGDQGVAKLKAARNHNDFRQLTLINLVTNCKHYDGIVWHFENLLHAACSYC